MVASRRSGSSLPRPNSWTMTSKVQSSRGGSRTRPRLRCRRAWRRSARRRPDPDGSRTGARRQDRRSAGSARAGDPVDLGRERVTQTVLPRARGAAASRPDHGSPADAQPAAPPSSVSAGTPSCPSQAATLAELGTPVADHDRGPAGSATRRPAGGILVRQRAEPGTSRIRGEVVLGSDVDQGGAVGPADQAGELVGRDRGESRHARAASQGSRTRCLGMSPRGEIAAPMADLSWSRGAVKTEG